MQQRLQGCLVPSSLPTSRSRKKRSASWHTMVTPYRLDHGQVLPPQQLLQQPDQSTENTEVGRSAVGHQLVVALGRHTHTDRHTQSRMVGQSV